MSQQNYAFFSGGDQEFEFIEMPETVRDQQNPQGRFFALSPDSELASRAAHSKVREALQSKDRPEKRPYFAQESEAQKGLKAERLLSRYQNLEAKLLQRKGNRKS